MRRSLLILVLGLVFMPIGGWADNSTDFEIQDDVTVLGEEGTLNDADVEFEGEVAVQRDIYQHAGQFAGPFAGFGRIENLLTYSQEFDNSSWITTDATAAGNQSAPDQSNTAYQLTNSGGSGGSISQSVAGSGSTDYVFSIWLKAGTSNSAEIEISDNGSTPASKSETISLSDKWKRYEVSFTSASDANSITVKVINNGADNTSIYIWGAQLEEGKHSGVYVKTGANPVSERFGLGVNGQAYVEDDVIVGDGSGFNNNSGEADLYVAGNLEVDGSVWLGDEATVDTLTVTGNMNFSGDLDMQGNRILNIGNAGTDFDDTGGLTLAGDLAVNGGDITSSASALNITPADGGGVYITDGTNTLMSISDAGTVGDMSLTGSANISGDATIGGNLTVNGDTVLGDESGDLLTVHGRISQVDTGYSVFIGEGAGASDDLSDNENVFVGYQAGYSNTSGDYNTAMGYQALYSNTTGEYNTAIGTNSLYSNDTGWFNTAIGDSSLYSNMTGGLNTAIGYYSLYSNTTGKGNTAIGTNSLYSNTTGEGNTAIGTNSLYSNDTGWFNTAIGANSLYSNTTGETNLGLGFSAGSDITTGSYNIMVGYNVQADDNASDSQLNIGNTIKGRVLTGFDAVKYYDGTSYTKVTDEAKTTGGTAYTILADTDDYFYIGSERKFNQVHIDLDQAGAEVSLSVEYYNGSSWTTLSVTDGTNGLSQDGVISFTMPDDWSTTNIDGSTKYYIRLHTTTNPTTIPMAYSTTRGDGGSRLRIYSNEGDSVPALVVDASKHIGINNSLPSVGLTVGNGTVDNVSDEDDAYIAGNLEVDGTIYGTVSSSSITDDSLDWDKFIDNMTLDATTRINMDNNSADFEFDSTDHTLYIDSANDRIGIGTDAPGSKLHILGTDNGIRLGYDGTKYALLRADASGNLLISNNGSADTISITSSGNNSLQASSTTTSRLILKSDTDDNAAGSDFSYITLAGGTTNLYSWYMGIDSQEATSSVNYLYFGSDSGSLADPSGNRSFSFSSQGDFWQRLDYGGFIMGSIDEDVIDDMEDISDWTSSDTTNTGVSLSSDPVIRGQGAMEITTSSGNSSGDTVTKSFASSQDFRSVDKIGFWIRATGTGQIISIELDDDSASTDPHHDITIERANQWQYEEWDISGIDSGDRDVISAIKFIIDNDTGSPTVYVDELRKYNSSTRGFEVYTDTGANTVLFSNGKIIIPSDVEIISGGSFTLQGSARHQKVVRISPEYPNVVFYADGTDNSGTLESGVELPATNDYVYSYYKWSTTQTTQQDYDIYIRWPVPSDFGGFPLGIDNALVVDIATATTSSSDNAVDVYLYKDGSATTLSSSDLDNVSTTAGGWNTDQENNAVIKFASSDSVLSSLSSGDVLVIRMKVKANNTNSGWAKVGAITVRYLSKW